MGKVTLIVEGSTVGTVANGGGITVSKEISETDSGRLIHAYGYSYRDKWKNEDGTPRQPRIEEVLQAWFDGVANGSIAQVMSVETEIAAKEAAANVKPISVT